MTKWDRLLAMLDQVFGPLGPKRQAGTDVVSGWSPR